MLGAILGDIVGSPYEFDHNNYKHKDFPLLSEKSHFTDDTVMTAAVAVGLIDGKGLPERTFCAVQHEMRFWGREYPHAGYGGMFRRWLHAENPKPYGSFGNGSAMRVSAAGWLFDTLDKTLEMAKVTAEVTHNHPEGIKGAQATAAAIFLARTGHSKTPACVLCAKHSTWAGVVLLWFVRTVRTGRNIIFVEFRPADTGYRDGRFPLLPAPAWRAQRGCADGGTLPAAHPCSETAYPR